MLACAAAMPAMAIDYPARKPGLWEIQTGDGTAAKGASQTIQQCIDAASDKALRDMGQGMGKDTCSKQELRNEGGKLVIDSVCKIGSTTATSHAVMSGDFSSAYRMESKSTYSPPLMGRAEGSGRHRSQVGRPLQGRPEARRHDHVQRHEDERARNGGRAQEQEVGAGPQRFAARVRQREGQPPPTMRPWPRRKKISSSLAPRGCIARRAISTSTRGGRWRAPSSRTPTPTTRASAMRTTWRIPTAPARCALASAATSRCRRSATAKPSSTTACAFRCIRPATCWARHRFASNTAGACGWPRATTRPSPTAPARPSSPCRATPSSPNRPSACRSTAGPRRPRCSRRSMHGGAPTRRPAAHRCCSAMPSARRSASCMASTPPSGRSWCTARSSRSTRCTAPRAWPCPRRCA